MTKPAPRNPFEFPAELQALADLLARQRERLEQDMAAGLKSPDAQKAPMKEHALMLRDLASAATSLGRELRQWDGHSRTQLDSMTPARKATVVMRFIQDQPLSARRDIYSVLARNEADRPDGLGISITDRFASGTTADE